MATFNNENSADELLSKYQLQAATSADSMGLPAELVHGAVAAVTDFGTTMWNSIAAPLGADEVSTSDMLSRIDKDALQVYNEHPDAVKTASFIGGIFVPAGLALKGMTALRAGTKGVSWFSTAGETSNLTKAAEAFANSRGSSEVLNQSKKMLYGAMAANAVVDNVAMETAIIMTMNAHPYMEDYMDDLPSNFLLGAAIGSTIGLGVGAIQTGYKIKNVLQPIEVAAYKEVGEGMKAVPESMNLGDQLLTRQQNIANWEATLKNKPELDNFTKNVLDHVITSNKAKIATDFDEMAKGELTKAGQAEKDSVIDLMKSDRQFAHVDDVDYLRVEDTTTPITKTGLLASIPKLFTKNEVTGVTRKNATVYLQEFKQFVSASEAGDYSSVVDLTRNIETLKNVSYKEFSTPRADAFLNRQIVSTAEVEADDAKALLFVNKHSVEELNTMHFHPEDLAMKRALYIRAAQLPLEEQGKINFKFTSEAPSYGKQVQMAVKGAGFSPKYIEHIKQLDLDRQQFQVYDGKLANNLGGVSKETAELLHDWTHGQYSVLRQAASDIANKGSIRTLSPSVGVKSLEEVINHPRSIAFRAEMHTHADADGNVLLYRGMRNAPKGHSPLESYSLNPGKAKAFANSAEGLRLYKVHVDDIVGTIEDYATTADKAHSNMEILVMLKNLTRENAVIPLSSPNALPSKFFGKEGELVVPKVIYTGGTKTISSVQELSDANTELLLKLDDILVDTGYKSESVAKRLGVIDASYKEGLYSSKFTSEVDIIAALDPTKRALVLNTNLQKTHFAELRTSLNNSSLDMMNSNIVETIIHGSQDEVVRGVGELVGSPDMRIQIKAMMDGIAEVSATGLGSTLFRSANTAVERFGVAGTIATKIGADVTHYINQTTEKLVKPISNAMGNIVKKESLVYEANMAMNVNASLKGPRLYKDGQFWQNVFDEATQKTVLKPVLYQGKEFRITSPEVLALFDTFQTAGRSMYHLANSSNKILGKTPVTDLGFWIPAFNPRNKEVAYVLDPVHGTSVLWAKTSAELNDKINAFSKTAKADGRNVEILSKDSNFEAFNKLRGREDELAMQAADISMQHTGASASAVVSTNTELLTEVINSYDHLVAKGITDLVDIQLAPVMDRLQMVSELSQRLHNPKAMGVVQKALSAKKDPGMVMRNILLGKGLLSEHESWAGFQQKTQVFTDMALEKLASLTTPVFQKLGEKGARTEESFIQFNKEIETAGFMPFKAVDDFVRYQQEGRFVSGSMTPRAIALFNATAATTLLRFMELAQPFVNMISMPILMSGAMRKELAPVFMGKELVGDPQFKLAATIHDAIRLMNHPTEGARIAKLGEDRQLFKSIVSEANAAMAHAKSLDPGLMVKGESLLESNFIKMMSKPADWSETMTRKMAFFTGYTMAKKAYPGMDEVGNITFARSFMDEAIGNYVASQRPAMFQGTFGVAMGIFQTYMFTLGQQLYRGIERGDWVGLSKQMLTQATVFGASSLPGFHVVSEQIGAHYSDNHVDLTTGLMRAVDDDVGKTLLYGLPASIGMGITTRGDIQPRLPNPIQGLDSLAAYNMTKQAWQAGKNITSAALSADENAGRAFVEALSAQSISRPIARLSELVSGRSVTGAGNTIASNTTGNPFAEEFSLHGAVARVMATRPIEEVMARQAIQLDSVYKGVDGDNRRALIKRLRSHIQSGQLDGGVVQEMQYEYLKTGSPQGWRSSVNDALRQKVEGGNASVKSKLHPDAPYMRMVDNLG